MIEEIILNAKQLSKSVFIENKYSRWYWNIIQKAQIREKPQKSERHHILPKGKLMFPQFQSLKLNPWNGVHLTLREHFLCHLFLTKMTVGEAKRSCVYGLMRFSTGIDKCNSRQYEKAKTLFRDARRGCPNPLKGKPGRKWSDEEKALHSIRMKDAMSKAETKKRCSLAKLGKPGHKPTEQHRAAISYAQKNLTPIQRKRQSDSKLAEKNGVFGKCWVTNGETTLLIAKSDTIPEGYRHGRVVKKASQTT